MHIVSYSHSHVPEVAQMGGSLMGYTTINRNEDKEVLFEKMVKMLEEFRLNFDMEDIEVNASRRTAMLMVLHLYLNLPSLIPKLGWNFLGHRKARKENHRLHNPSKKSVKYQVQLQGCQDFALSSQEVEIGAHSSANYLVTLDAKFFEPTISKNNILGCTTAWSSWAHYSVYSH